MLLCRIVEELKKTTEARTLKRTTPYLRYASSPPLPFPRPAANQCSPANTGYTNSLDSTICMAPGTSPQVLLTASGKYLI